MNKFKKVNLKYLREHATALMNSGQSLDGFYHFHLAGLVADAGRNTADAYEHHLKTEHFLTYKQGTLHMVKSLNLVDLSPLDKDAMPLIFTKIQ